MSESRAIEVGELYYTATLKCKNSLVTEQEEEKAV